MKRTLLLYIIALLLFSCRGIGLFNEDEVVARVGDRRLYLSEVESVYQPGISPEDSVQLLRQYVDMWVRRQLKTKEAEKMLGESTAEIDRMVEEYRNSLLGHKIDQYYVEQKLDTLYTQQEIVDYYNLHKSEFILSHPLVKGVIVKVPDSYRQIKQLKESMAAKGDKYQDFLDISQKNKFDLAEFNSWAEFSEFLSFLPTTKQRSYDDLLPVRAVQEIRAGGNTYLFLISDHLAAGDAMPLEKVEEMIKRVIFVHRKQEIIRAYEDSIYHAAVEGKKVEVRTKSLF